MFTFTPILVPIRPIVYEIVIRNARWWQTGNLTLRLNQMTLTLILHIDNSILNLSAKFETNRTNHSWSTAETNFSENHDFDLDLWPYDLDLIPKVSPHQCLPSHQFGSNPTNHSWSTAETNFSENHEFDLDLWPNDLDILIYCSMMADQVRNTIVKGYQISFNHWSFQPMVALLR